MKKSFYLKYLEEQKNKEKLDVKKSSSFFLLLIKIFGNSVNKISKSLVYILLTILVSIGVTAIINPSIREIFVNLFKGGF